MPTLKKGRYKVGHPSEKLHKRNASTFITLKNSYICKKCQYLSVPVFTCLRSILHMESAFFSLVGWDFPTYSTACCDNIEYHVSE